MGSLNSGGCVACRVTSNEEDSSVEMADELWSISALYQLIEADTHNWESQQLHACWYHYWWKDLQQHPIRSYIGGDSPSWWIPVSLIVYSYYGQLKLVSRQSDVDNLKDLFGLKSYGAEDHVHIFCTLTGNKKKLSIAEGGKLRRLSQWSEEHRLKDGFSPGE